MSIIEEFENLLPKHKAGLAIEHNPHRGLYETVELYVKDNRIDFENNTDMQQSIDNDELWVCRWYPQNAVGFYEVAAPTLTKLIELTKQVCE